MEKWIFTLILRFSCSVFIDQLNYKNVKSHNITIDRAWTSKLSILLRILCYFFFCVESNQSSFETKWRIMWFRLVCLCVRFVNFSSYWTLNVANFLILSRFFHFFFTTATIEEKRELEFLFFSFSSSNIKKENSFN